MKRMVLSLALLAATAACGNASPTGPDALLNSSVMGTGARSGDDDGLVGSGGGEATTDGGLIGSIGGRGEDDGSGSTGSGCCATTASTEDGGALGSGGGRTGTIGPGGG
jgi:hypothetical protein